MRTRTLITIVACSLVMTSCGGRGARKIVTDTVSNEVARVNFSDSLDVVKNAGPVVTDVYSGLLPGADVSGINYSLTLVHYQTLHNGVYELGMTYLGTKDGKDAHYTTHGRYNTLTGIVGNAGTSYISLVPFEQRESEANFAITPGGLTLLGEDMTLPASELNFTLVKKP